MTTPTRRFAAITTAAILLVATPLVGSAFAQQTSSTFPVPTPSLVMQQNHTVSVTGTGTVSIAPDTATSDVGVETRGETAREAQQKNADATKKLIDGLVKLGIARSDIKTSWYNVYPQYDYSKEGQQPTLTGYSANHNLSIKIRDLSKVSDVIDRATELGATSVSGVNYTVEKKDAAVDEARRLAAGDADEKANKLAGIMKFDVGSIASVTEMSDTGMVYPMMGMGGAMDAKNGASTPVQPGTIDVTVTLNVSYEIE